MASCMLILTPILLLRVTAAHATVAELPGRVHRSELGMGGFPDTLGKERLAHGHDLIPPGARLLDRGLLRRPPFPTAKFPVLARVGQQEIEEGH